MFSSNATQVAGSTANYIEDVFSTYLYTGNGTSQTITNGIDLSTYGGLVWLKNRTTTSTGQMLYDTVRGAYKYIQSDATNAEGNGSPDGLSAFTSSGFSLNGASDYWNISGDSFVSWAFKEQPKFFDVITYTGTGVNRTVAHNLGSVPGCIMIKNTSASGQNWRVWHTSLNTTSGDQALSLNLTSSSGGGSGSYWNYTLPTSSVFTVGTDDSVNGSGRTYVAYIFATNAGGFGLTGTDNVISCGSVVNTGNPQVTLGYEPQWVLFKSATSTSSWYIVDNMRGLAVKQDQAVLLPNSSVSEVTNSNYININATGFTTNSSLIVGETLIYIAIRRGPMKVPTVGTSVLDITTGYAGGAVINFLADGFNNNANSSTAADMIWGRMARNGTGYFSDSDRLRGITSPSQGSPRLVLSAIDAETTAGAGGQASIYAQANTAIIITGSTAPSVGYAFHRAPSFFDEVCYSGTGSARTVTHNLATVPELMIVKSRSSTGNWPVYAAASGATNGAFLDDISGFNSITTLWNSTAPTSSVFTVGTTSQVNDNAVTYVAYLFATCSGVSKVGSYTGTGATQTIACGFAGGARFVLVKRTDTTGDWYVWDTVRGMVSGTDPSLLLNSTAAEVNANSVFTIATGFQIVSTAAGINASGGTYIFLAIA